MIRPVKASRYMVDKRCELRVGKALQWQNCPRLQSVSHAPSTERSTVIKVSRHRKPYIYYRRLMYYLAVLPRASFP